MTRMFQRIVVASDLTPQCGAALRFAGGFGATFGSKLVVAHVVDAPPALPAWAARALPGLDASAATLDERTRAAEQALDAQVTAAGLASTRGVRVVVRAGDPATTLARLVEELDADLVIVARGRGGRLGAIAEQLVRLMGRTVLVAPVRGRRAVDLDARTQVGFELAP